MKIYRKDEGFTLVELMVVVLIIGILVAIAIPVFNAAQDSARNRTCQANQRTIDGACQQYLATNPSVTAASMDDISVLYPTYIKQAPDDPGGAVAYTIVDATCQGCPSAVHDDYTD